MNRTRRPEFDPSSPLLRKAFGVAAVAVTFAVAHAIDALALGYGTSAPLFVQHAPIVVAHR